MAGRWNSIGVPLVYASQSVALAYLEMLAHVAVQYPPHDYWLFEMDIPEKFVRRLSVKDCPKEWNKRPPANASRKVGNEWFKRRESLALMVPSVIVPFEANVLVNPQHPKFDLDWVKGPTLFLPDTRLLPKTGAKSKTKK